MWRPAFAGIAGTHYYHCHRNAKAHSNAKHDADTLRPKLSPLGFLFQIINVYSIVSLNFGVNMYSENCSTFWGDVVNDVLCK